MIQRVTVSSLVNSQDPLRIFKAQEDCQSLQIDQKYIYVHLKSNKLRIYSLFQSQKILNEIQMTQQILKGNKKITVLRHNQNVLCFALQNSEDVFCHFLKENIMKKLSGHILPVTTIYSYMGSLVTGSKDMTIRFWEILNEGHKIRGPVAITGHSGKINCLNSYSKFLISGSQDRTLKFWSDKKIWSSFQFSSSPLSICTCPESSQVCIFLEQLVINFINVPLIAKHKRIQIQSTLKIDSFPLSSCEIDDSFMVYSDSNQKMNFLEVNLIKSVHRKEIECQQIRVQGRIIFFVNKSFQVSMIKI